MNSVRIGVSSDTGVMLITKLPNNIEDRTDLGESPYAAQGPQAEYNSFPILAIPHRRGGFLIYSHTSGRDLWSQSRDDTQVCEGMS